MDAADYTLRNAKTAIRPLPFLNCAVRPLPAAVWVLGARDPNDTRLIAEQVPHRIAGEIPLRRNLRNCEMLLVCEQTNTPPASERGKILECSVLGENPAEVPGGTEEP
jgi:hypothetical protein